ncbi:unnamed protein product [Ilex paraguariensis]|uniref:Uncharacterized protein n=1 Tax=Ilex paraguariensis TaxID=185542 RepID=A0ABC8TY07_9AQUA
MSAQSASHSYTSVDQKLARLSPIPFECNLFRVQDHTRRINVKAYEPEVIAIGPYHHGKPNLQAMEEHKLRYLLELLIQAQESSVERYYMAMRALKDRALKCYAEPISLTDDEFVEMMLLDGCFLLGYILKCNIPSLVRTGDPITFSQVRFGMVHDLLLYENQLPFFIIVQLFSLINVSYPQFSIMSLTQSFLAQTFGYLKIEPGVRAWMSIGDVNHLLGLAYCGLCLPFVQMVPHNVGDDGQGVQFINCTTELQEAGILLKEAKESISFLDVRFTNGVLEIPSFVIEDLTENFFRNLMTYEQYCPATSPYVTDYIIFMNRLINSSKDVELLRRCGIIIDWFGNDVAVHAMLTNLAKNAMRMGKFSYSEVCKNLHLHCRRRRNVWMANLRRNYLNNPWAIISFFAAVLLLILTFTQTVFSILPQV